ncbi:MAG TPA: UDP-N-acetylglucosamine--N-acetylmuramyl-(pentapeptide) pyrophosphoryl-undecaprenol N-acetylglucosamine transferase, partial [Erwinia persicina]|nr:UDP-N-acetylglucosamine--N-acetylmuramyl-(pentapeptide) pyrophosphoryl-undecaprenol N-acetylglucosamine transferase [Erwinia persicina]
EHRQQVWKALPLEQAGAAKMFEQPQCTAEGVAAMLTRWDRATLLQMAVAARAMAMPNATERVAAEVSKAAK